MRCLCAVTASAYAILRPLSWEQLSLSLFDQLLSGRLIFFTYGPLAQPLVLKMSLLPSKNRISFEAICCLYMALRCLSIVNSPDLEKLPPALLSLPLSHYNELTSSLSLSLATQRYYSGNRSASEFDLCKCVLQVPI